MRNQRFRSEAIVHAAAGDAAPFGAFEAIADSSIKLARVAPEEEVAMDVLVAEAVLEFGDDLRAARYAASTRTASIEVRGG